MTERRRCLRFETVLNALCEVMQSREKTRSTVKNISKEGALIILDRELMEGAEISISLEIPGDNMPVFASGQVAWQRGEPNGKSAFYQTGVRFTGMEGSDKGRLLEYIYTQWLRLLDSIPY